jgi:hypothetical protein
VLDQPSSGESTEASVSSAVSEAVLFGRMVSAPNRSIAVCRILIWFLLMLSTFMVPAVHC